MLRTHKLDNLPEEPKDWVVRWEGGESKPMSVQRARYLMDVGNTHFRARKHSAHRVGLKVKTGVNAGSRVETAVKVLRSALCAG